MREQLTDEALVLMASGSKPGSVGLDYDEALTSLARELLARRRANPADAKSALEAYGREKVREGMQRAAEIAADRCAACGVREIAGLVKAHILANIDAEG